MTDGPDIEERVSVLSRLRERKVVQWSLAYVAGAWGLLQGLAYLSATFEWPGPLQRLATIAVAIGLPISIVLAWYHGDRGQQRATRVEIAILTLLVLLGAGLLWFYQRTAKPSAVAQPAAVAASATRADDRSIAILPFVNMSSDHEQEYFADGLSEELLNLLAQVPQLRVIARTSSFSFKGRSVDIATIARQLNVSHVLEGSVRRSGDELRITAQLIRASDSSHLWSQTYDRHVSDVFQIQDEIAAAVVDQLKIKLLGESPKSRATDPDAYALFLQARELGRQSTAAGFEQSIALYQQALSIDPGYAAAWANIAYARVNQVINGIAPVDRGIPLARSAIDHALLIDPDNAQAYAALGWTALLYDRDLAAAAVAIERALSLDPGNPDILNVAAVLARRLARFDLAIAIGKSQVARDPLNTDARGDLAVANYYAGHLDAGIAEFRNALRLRPGFLGAHHMISGMLLLQGKADEALGEAQLEPNVLSRLAGLSVVEFALGRGADSDAALAKLVQDHAAMAAFEISTVYAYRGENDAAFEWMEKAARDRHPGLGAIPAYPLLGNLRADPRWLPFLRRHGLAPEQLAAIRFDVKPPT
jgi:TolB-like protein